MAFFSIQIFIFEHFQDESSLQLPAQYQEMDDMILIESIQRLAKKTYECLAKQESSELKLAAQLYDACVEIKEYLNSTDNS